MKHSEKYNTQYTQYGIEYSGIFGEQNASSTETIDKLLLDDIDMSICYCGADFQFLMGQHPNNDTITKNNTTITEVQTVTEGYNIYSFFSKEWNNTLNLNIPLNVAFVMGDGGTAGGVDYIQPCLNESDNTTIFNNYDWTQTYLTKWSRFVNKMDIDKYIYKVPNRITVFDTDTKNYVEIDFETLINDKNNRYYMTTGGLQYYDNYIYIEENHRFENTYTHITPVFIINTDELKGVFCIEGLLGTLKKVVDPARFWGLNTYSSLNEFDGQYGGIPYTNTQRGIYLNNVIKSDVSENITIGANFEKPFTVNYSEEFRNYPDGYKIKYEIVGDYCYLYEKYGYYGGGYRVLQSSQAYIKMLASFGCYVTAYDGYITDLYNDNFHVYIGEMLPNGRTTGRLIKASELPNDAPNRTGSIEHEYFTPVTPLQPEIDEERPYDLENMKISWADANTSPFTKAYVCSKEDLQQLVYNMYNASDIPVGRDLFTSLVALYYYPFKVSEKVAPVTAENIEISGWNSQVVALPVTNAKGIELVATIPIEKQYNDFRDFSPYTKYNLFLPYIGQITLDDFCVGHTINVFYGYDFLSGTCKACLFMDNILYKQFSGVMGVSREFTAVETGLKREAIVTGVVNSLVHTAENVTSYIDEKEVGTLGNLFGGLVSDLTSTGIAQNKSFKSTAGATSTLIDVIQADKCYLTIVTQNCVIPENYAHTYGYILNKKRVLSNVSGFTVCENVDVSGLECTEEEKQMIKNYLETGVYL